MNQSDTDGYRFIGEFEHSVDGKNRVILPSTFRESLDDDEQLVITPGVDHCLFVFPYVLWEELVQSDELQGLSENSRHLKRAFTAMANKIDVDSQGRILIPQKHKSHADINDKVTVVGNYDRVELWSPEIWEEFQQSIDVDQLAETVFEPSHEE